MATLNDADGIANLQRFVANLAAATAALETITDHVQEASPHLEQLEKDAGDHGGGLNDRLEGLRETIEKGQEAVRQAIDEVGQAGTAGRDVIAAAEATVDRASGELAERAQAVSSHLDERHARLAEQGFAPLGQSLDEIDHQLERAREGSQHAFEELEAGLRGFATEAQAAWDGGISALERTAAELAAEGAALVAEASSAQEALASSGAGLEAFCSTLDTEISAVYEGFAASADTAAQELAEAGRSRLQDAAGFLEASGQSRLEDPADTLDAEGFGPLGEESAALDEVLGSAALTAAEVEPLAGELAKCQAIVGEIEKLLNAIAE